MTCVLEEDLLRVEIISRAARLQLTFYILMIMVNVVCVGSL